MNKYFIFLIMFISACSDSARRIDSNTNNNPSTNNCLYNGSYSQEGANIKVTWNSSSKPCINSCGGGYKIYYKKRMVEADDIFLEDIMDLPSSVSVFDVPYSSQSATAPSSAELNLSAGKWFVKISSYCQDNESDPSNAFVVEVE